MQASSLGKRKRASSSITQDALEDTIEDSDTEATEATAGTIPADGGDEDITA